jgi:predicted ester cyclase
MEPQISSKQIGLRWFEEIWTHRNPTAAAGLMAADARGHLEGGAEIVGPDQFLQFQKAVLEAIPDMRVDVLKALAQGDHACFLWIAKGTHSGEGFGLKATGREVTFRGTTWLRVTDGKIVEGWDCWNQGGLFAALSSK